MSLATWAFNGSLHSTLYYEYGLRFFFDGAVEIKPSTTGHIVHVRLQHPSQTDRVTDFSPANIFA